MYKLLIALILLAPAWDLAQWQPITQSCSRIEAATLIMECESAGLASNQRYSGAMHVSVEVQAEPIGTSPHYWAGLALNSDVAADDQYAEVALTQGIAPFNDLAQPSAVLLSTTGKVDCCLTMGTIDPALWYTLTIDYANGRATYTIDGTSRTIKVNLGRSYQIELLCVAVNPGTSKPGALTRCQWRNLTIAPIVPARSRRA